MTQPITIEALEIQQKIQFLYIVFNTLCVISMPLSMFGLADGFSEFIPFILDLICCACGLLLAFLTFKHPLLKISIIQKLIASICFLTASTFAIIVGFLLFGDGSTKAVPYLSLFLMVVPSIIGGIIIFNFIPIFSEVVQLAKKVKENDGESNNNQDPSGGAQNSQSYNNYAKDQNTHQTVTIQDQNQTEVSLNDNNLQENLNPDQEPQM